MSPIVKQMLGEVTAEDTALDQIGHEYVQDQIEQGKTPEEAEAAWQNVKGRFSAVIYNDPEVRSHLDMGDRQAAVPPGERGRALPTYQRYPVRPIR